MYITTFFEDTTHAIILENVCFLNISKGKNFQGQFNSYIIPLRIYIFDDF